MDPHFYMSLRYKSLAGSRTNLRSYLSQIHRTGCIIGLPAPNYRCETDLHCTSQVSST